MNQDSIHAIARRAFRTRALVRLPFGGGDPGRIRTVSAPHAAEAPPEPVAGLVDSLWDTHCAGRHDGRLMGVVGAAVRDEQVTLFCGAMRYRDYLAADRVLAHHPGARLPLAVGVHAILTADEGVICLRLDDGRLGLPGGAVDSEDLANGAEAALVRAAEREVAEETGLALAGRPVEVTGLYVGGFPTHLLVMLTADLRGTCAAQSIRAFSPVDPFDRVRAIELHPLGELLRTLEDLPLAMRVALKSLRHREGGESAWSIPA